MDRKERLIDYLYGEMTEAERRSFEEILAQDAELRSELEALRQTRRQLAAMPEARPEALVLPMAPVRPAWKKWTLRGAVAAAAVLLLSLSNARLEIGSGGFAFTVGKPAPAMTEEEPGQEAQLMATLEEQFLQRDRALDQKLLQLDSLWQNRLVRREAQLQDAWDRRLAVYQARRQEELKQFADYLVSEEMPDLVALVQQLQLEQKEELRGLLTHFWNQWQENRAADLQSIETEFVNVYRNVELNQSETQAILRDVLSAGR
jgi:hypothetical protein